MQKYKDVNLNTEISTGLQILLDRDQTVLTKSSGETFPEAPVEGQIYVAEIESKVYKWSTESGGWLCLWDFSTGTPLCRTELNSDFQAKHPNLSSISGANDVVQNDVLMFNNKKVNFSPITQAMLPLTTAAETIAYLGIGDIAKLNAITHGNQIRNASITANKIGKIVDGQFVPMDLNTDVERAVKTGDIKRSFNRKYDKSKFLNLDGSTIGSNGSYADYTPTKGYQVQKLYALLWQNGTPVMYSANSSTVVPKGSSWENDWSAGKKLKLADMTANGFTVSSNDKSNNEKVNVADHFFWQFSPIANQNAPTVTDKRETNRIVRTYDKLSDGSFVLSAEQVSDNIANIQFVNGMPLLSDIINNPKYINVPIAQTGSIKVKLSGSGGQSYRNYYRKHWHWIGTGGAGATFSGEVGVTIGNVVMRAGSFGEPSAVEGLLMAGRGSDAAGNAGSGGAGGSLTRSTTTSNESVTETGNGYNGWAQDFGKYTKSCGGVTSPRVSFQFRVAKSKTPFSETSTVTTATGKVETTISGSTVVYFIQNTAYSVQIHSASWAGTSRDYSNSNGYFSIEDVNHITDYAKKIDTILCLYLIKI